MMVLIETSDPTRDFALAKRDWRLLLREMRKAQLIEDDQAGPLMVVQRNAFSGAEAIAIGTHFSELLDHAEVPPDIDLDVAERFARFASTSQGFEIR